MDRPLKIGDTVRWKGCWGEAQEKLAVVTGMETRCIGKDSRLPRRPGAISKPMESFLLITVIGHTGIR